MALVTISEVKDIIDTSLEDASITAFINMASTIVTDKLDGKSCLTDEAKKEIEKLLTAHFITMNDRQLSASKTGDASFTYQGATGMGLQASLFGQSAILFDCSNTLVNLGKIQMKWDLASQS